MSKAVTCPVCLGSGNKNRLLYDRGKEVTGKDETCHGCSGKGWVEVGGDYMTWWPGVSPPIPPSPPIPFWQSPVTYC